MIKIETTFVSKSALEGPPFVIIINEKSKYRLRKWYFIMFLLWVMYSLSRYSMQDPVVISAHFILVLLYLPAIIILLQNQLIITGDHNQWRLLKVKNLFGKHIIIYDIKSHRLKIEIRVVSAKPDSTSLILLNNDIKKLGIKSPNIEVKEFMEECRIINLPVKIRKRGIINS